MNGSNHPTGTFCWFECGSKDASKSKAFYTGLFGWTAADMPMPGDTGTYTLLRAGEADVAGLYELTGPQFDGVPSHWLSYVAVEDVDETARKVGALGGKVVAEPMDVPGVGRMAVVQDNTGAVIAIARFDQHPGTLARGPFGWCELATRDTNQAASFYGKVFGWTTKPDAQNFYTEFQAGGESIAGMMAMTPEYGEAPPHWLPYVMVEDCDAIARTATKLGAGMCVPPKDIEKVGRFAIFSDPAGATLAVIQLLRR